MKKTLGLLSALFATQAVASETTITPYADFLFRYEHERSHHQIDYRERIRLIGRAGIKMTFPNQWQGEASVRTGLRDQQNVAAITIHKFSDQPQPDNDLFLERLYLKGKIATTGVTVGKMPWPVAETTDMFWDRDLKPVGLDLKQPVNENHTLQVAHLLPLDGESNTAGKLSIAAWNSEYLWRGHRFKVSPWYSYYQSDANARYATRDTDLDHEAVHLSASVQRGLVKVGFDYSRALENYHATEVGADFDDQKEAYAVELKMGTLKRVNDIEWSLRYLHVERFGVITEFAQNATTRIGTSNIKGWDARWRRQMGEQWWLSARYSDMDRITGNPEKGHRFRIEAKVSF